MYKTKNDLPESTRRTVIEHLAARLVDAVDLHAQAKQAHWNVKGPTFSELHELFDEVSDDAREYGDLLAERVVQLGGWADGDVRSVAARSKLEPYPRVVRGHEHVEAIASTLARFAKAVRTNIDDADRSGDKASADLFTEIARGVDKWLWKVESHLQA